MAKTFNIIKRHSLLNGEKSAVFYVYGSDAVSEEKILRKLNDSRKVGEDVLFDYCYGEKMHMHLLPGLSDAATEELSRYRFHTAYAVCKKSKKGEEVLYLSLFKDSALRFKASVPSAVINAGSRQVANPNYYVKELRLCL